MSSNDDDLKSLFAAAFVSDVPKDDCPDPAALYEAFHRLSSLEERLLVLDHIAECPTCADAWRLASRTGPSAPERS